MASFHRQVRHGGRCRKTFNVLFPSGRWFSAEIETLRQRNGLTYERVSRTFQRLRKLLLALVPLPGDPFQLHRGGVCPGFPDRRPRRIAAREPAGLQDLSRSVTQKADNWRGIALSKAGRGR